MAVRPWRTLLVCTVIALLIAEPVAAQVTQSATAYRLGAGDVLQLNVLGRTELDRELTVQPDGTAFIPQVGEVAIGGLTLAEAEALVRQRLRLFNPAIDEVTLSIRQYNALRIYVLGAVNTPGPHTFTEIPDAWDVLRAAGGPREGANLGAVRIVTRVEGRTQTRTVNLTGLLTGGEVPNIELNSGDTMVVPDAGEGVAMSAPVSGGVTISGAVGAPSVVALDGPTRLLTCLMMAGAPLETAQLNRVWWVHHEGNDRYTSRRVDLEQYFQKGLLAGNPLIYPGDTLQMEYDRPGWFERYLPLFLGTIATTMTVLLAYDRLSQP